MTKKLTPPLKWHGGKSYLAKWIISLMPPRCATPNKPKPSDPGWLHYVEPYFGGGAVLLANDPAGISEVVNDKNAALTNFWRVLKNDDEFCKMQRQLDAVPFSGNEFQWAGMIEKDPLLFESHPWRRALKFFIRCRQSLSGRMNGFAGITRNRTRRGMNEQVSAWLGCIEGLPKVHERLRRVLILNDDALNVIRKEDGPRTLFYLDPTYLHETRATTGEYEHEMSEADHRELLEVLCSIEGRFLLSGYPSKLYHEYAGLQAWNCHEREIDNKAAGGKTKRTMTECVWTNF